MVENRPGVPGQLRLVCFELRGQELAFPIYAYPSRMLVAERD